MKKKQGMEEGRKMQMSEGCAVSQYFTPHVTLIFTITLFGSLLVTAVLQTVL
jgi:hypothetical protein